MLDRSINSKRIRVVSGDITSRDTVAIVNAANNHLWMGSGVAGAIKRRGGQVIEDEAMRLGPIPVGEAVVTGAGALPQRFVIHAAAMGQDLRTDAALIEAATRNALLRCAEREIESVSFPALGTGVGGFPVRECAEIMLAAAAAHLASHDYPKLVEFVLWGEDVYRDFAAALEKMELKN
ncbi:MAG: macro domain-containing protein [bacterium]|jgi:O-acetyl-ADP-ribose deacetylase (regulator of RNase III)